MKTIVFVDDEPKLLNALRRTLRSYRDQWRMIFVSRPQQALDILATQPVHVVITDIQMPEMNGLELLEHFRKKSPETLRVVLTGHADKKQLLESVDIIHQNLQKPCETEIMVNTIQRSLALQDNITNQKLKSLVSQMNALPSLPSQYRQLMRTLRSPESSIEDVADVIIRDVGLMTRILHLVNSAYMGLPRNVSDPVTAINLIGLDMVEALAATMQVFSQFSSLGCKHFDIKELWNHSLDVAVVSKRIAEKETNQQQTIDDAFLAGLMHDVGRLILATQLPEDYSRLLDSNPDGGDELVEAELDMFGTCHAEVGAYLLGLWGVRTPILEAVAYHHKPSKQIGEGFTITIAVHVASALITYGEQSDEHLDMDYLTEVGLTEKLPRWQRLIETF